MSHHRTPMTLGLLASVSLAAAGCGSSGRTSEAERLAADGSPVAVAGAAAAGESASPAAAASGGARAHAYLAGGCFWCVETAYEGVPGVTAVISGYTGGPEKNPTYDQVSSGATGHYESVDVVYDPARISYEKILDIFWHNIDPTQGDGQFCDRGRQYRSAIFVRDSTERRVALRTKREVESRLRRPVVTEILPAARFWPAEEYHQDFWKKDPLRYTTYRAGCGRDRRLDQLWGKDARRGSGGH